MKKAVYLTGDLKKHLWDVSSASFLSLFITFSLNALGMYYISKLGIQSLTAISFVFPLFEVMVGLSLGVGIAALAKTATALGADDTKEAKHVAGCALMLSVALGTVLAFVFFSFNHSIFIGLGATLELLPAIDSYILIWYLGVPSIMCWMCCIFIFRAYGQAKYASRFVIICALLDTIISPFFIFGLFGLPMLGMHGAAMVTVLVKSIVSLVLCRKMLKDEYIVLSFERIKYYLSELGHIFFPAALTNLMPGLSIIFITKFLSGFSVAVAAYGIASKVQAIVVTPLFGLSGGMSPIIAQNAGAKQLARAHQTYRLASIFVLGMGVSLAIVLALLGSHITRLFTADEHVIQAASWYFYLVPCSYVGWGLIMISASNFNALNQAKRSTFLSAVRIIILFLPLAYGLEIGFGYRGVFLAVSLANLLAGLLGFILVERYYRVRI